MSLTLFPAPLATAPRPRLGRPRVADDPAARAKHLAVAKARLLYRARVKELARYHDVDAGTIWRWVRLALTYDDPEAVALRRLVAGAANAS